MSKKERKKDKKKKPARKARDKRALAADRHVLYQLSVQDPEAEIGLMLEKFTALRGRAPQVFREDFCGTAYLSVAWCQGDPGRSAIGIDLCQETLNWGRTHNVEPAGEAVSSRLQLLHADVLDVETAPADLICALNFSYSVFKDRATLRRYFANTLRGLNEDGVLMLDLFGGTEAITTLKEDREVDGQDFTYIWEQEKYNPITNEIICNIHFKFHDGSRLKQAFRYDWRLWTIAELKELLLEAGYSRVYVYWEEFIEDDEDSEYLTGTGQYHEVTDVENQEAWVSYIFAEK